jgi:iron uptake system EfeUOB component EfeO/EfeM
LFQLNPTIYEQERNRVAARFEQAVQLAEQAFINEFGKLIEHLTERLSSDGTGERKIFRDSAITNLTEFFERFRQLNVRSNADLDALVERAQQIVNGVEAQSLRDNNTLRQHVATQFSQVQSVIDGMLVDRPRRRIIRNQQEE